MRNLPQSPKFQQQSCPVCGASLAPGAVQCESCGTDLSKSGVLFSTQVRPVTLPHQHKLPRVLRRAKRASAFVILALGLVLLTGIGGVPAVSARVPVLGAIYERTFGLLLGVATRPPATSQSGQGNTFLLVRSTPSGAQVQVNDQVVGSTPLTLDLLPGSYRVRISREGYAPVSRTVEVSEGPVAVDVSLALGGSDEPEATRSPAPPSSPSPVPPAPRPVRPAAPRLPLAIGAKAPALALKDRLGILYRFDPDYSRRMALVFVWTLNDPTKQVIRDLDARIRKTAQMGGLVVMMGSDRVGVRNFLLTWQLKTPLVFGTPQVATLYHLPTGVDMLYLVSGRGTIEQVQKGTINPAAAIK